MINKNERLLILRAFLFPEEFGERMVLSWNTRKELIEFLRVRGTISAFYSSKNLDLDLWYLRSLIMPPVRMLDGSSISANEYKILFHVVCQSLKDLKNGRPCDLGIWLGDEPPDGTKCSLNEHICYVNAEQFLEGISHEDERAMGLSEGLIERLVCKAKRDPIFRDPFVHRFRTTSST